MTVTELYGSKSCPYTRDAREWLELRGVDVVEYDVEADPEARARWRAYAGAQQMVPVIVEEGRVLRVGWQGRGCAIGD